MVYYSEQSTSVKHQIKPPNLVSLFATPLDSCDYRCCKWYGAAHYFVIPFLKKLLHLIGLSPLFHQAFSLTGWGYRLDSRLSILELFLQYLLFKGLPLCLGKNTGVILLAYFHLSIRYLNYGATRTFTTQSYNFHLFNSSFPFRNYSPYQPHPQPRVFII